MIRSHGESLERPLPDGPCVAFPNLWRDGLIPAGCSPGPRLSSTSHTDCGHGARQADIRLIFTYMYIIIILYIYIHIHIIFVDERNNREVVDTSGKIGMFSSEVYIERFWYNCNFRISRNNEVVL